MAIAMREFIIHIIIDSLLSYRTESSSGRTMMRAFMNHVEPLISKTSNPLIIRMITKYQIGRGVIKRLVI